MREEECYWPAPWRPKMETLVTIWPSNVLSLLPLYLLLSSALRILSLSLCVSVFFFVLRPWVLFFLCFSVLVPSLHFFFISLCASPVFPAFLRFLFPSLCVLLLWICALLFLSSLLWFSSLVFCLGLAEVFFSVSRPKSHCFPPFHSPVFLPFSSPRFLSLREVAFTRFL